MGRGRVLARQLSQGPVLTSYARRALKINENGLATRRLIGPHPEFLSCLSTIADGCRNHTQKINDTCQTQMFPTANGNIPVHPSYDFSPRHSRRF